MAYLRQSAVSPFSDEQSAGELRRKTVRGAATTYVGQGLNVCLNFVSTAILARLLSPESFGLVAMTGPFLGFVAMFRDSGLSLATVQQEKVTHEQVSTLFWANLLLTSAMASILLLGAPALSRFFNEARLTGITRGVAVAFFLAGVGIQHRALLQRQMRFGALISIDIFSLVCGIITAVVMAKAGWGYWSLVGMSLVSSLAGILCAFVAMPWIPGLPRRGVGTKRMFRFGSDLLVLNVINYFSMEADTILLGRTWGPSILSFYDKAYRMLLMPIRQICGPMTSVIIPALSRVNRDPERLRRTFLQSVELVTGVSMPMVLGLCVFADEFVLLWLGPQWTACAHLFRLLTVAAVVGSLTTPIGWLMISTGNTRVVKWLGIFASSLSVTGILIGLPYGAEGVAIAVSCVAAIGVFPSWWIGTLNTPVPLRSVLRTLRPAVISAVVATVVGVLLSRVSVVGIDHRIMVAVAVLGYGGAYALLLLVAFRRWAVYLNVLREFGVFKSKRAPT